ncbi:MAG TPA: outer membrane protein assembly factor BamA, partial [Terriglobia bacterium]|nr:outer membrane protein assembly factor BamA [Terriglobia bacterium]
MKLVSLLLALWLQVPATVNSPIIDDIQVRGNRKQQNSSASLRYVIQSRRGDPLNRALVARDVRALYGREQFDDIWVEVEETTPGHVILVFHVSEKPTIRNVEYKGLSSIQTSDVLKGLSEKKATLTQGTPYDETRVQKAKMIIKAMLAEKGRQKAEVDVATEKVPPNSVLVTFNVTEGPKIKIDSINFEGNTVFTDSELKKSMKLVKEAGPLTGFNGKDAFHEGKLAYDLNNVRTLYAEKGYVRVNISDPIVLEKEKNISRTLPFVKPPPPWGIPVPMWNKSTTRLDVTLKVEENSQYHVGEVRVNGVTALAPEVVQNALALKKGDVYNETLLRESFDQIKKGYGRLGYINFIPTPQQDFDEERKLVNLTVTVDEGKQYVVDRINFAGNTTTRDKVIRREVPLVEGYLFDSYRWDLARMKLNQLGYFEEIKEEDAKIDANHDEPKVNVTMKVQEKSRNTIGFTGGVSGIGGSFIGGNYETNNFLGFGETLSVNVQAGTRQSNIMLGFSEPYFLDRPLSLGFNVFHSNYKYDQARELYGLDPDDLPTGLGFEERLNFQQARDGFSIYGSHPFKFASRVGLTFQLDNSRTEAVNPATQAYFSNIRTNEGQQVGFNQEAQDFGEYKTRKLIPSFNYSTVDNPYYPTRGRAVSLTFEYNGGLLGGNTNFIRPTTEFRFFRPHTKRQHVFAVRLLASHIRGFANTSVPFYERFYPGGDFDIRGFDFRSLGPISFLTRTVGKLDPETGGTMPVPFDDIVYVGGDTQGILNVEYRIPIVGRTVTL